MSGQLEYLIRLQEIDTQLSAIKSEKDRQPLQLENAKRPLQVAQIAHEQAKAAIDSASKVKRQKEQDLQAQEEHIEKLKARQSEIKTNKEYQAHLLELSAARQNKGHLEEEWLLLMEELDNDSKEVIQQEQAARAEELELKSKEQELAQQAIQLDQAQARLLAERAELLKQIQESLLRSYERLKSIRKDLAVVPILHGSCGGCHMNLPPQLVAEVKMDEQIHTCSHCHRILYRPHPIERAGKPVEVNPSTAGTEEA